MSIVDLFRLHFGTNTPATNDFSLIEYGSGILIGVDKASCVCVVVKSANPNRFPLKHKTQNMSIECNVKVRYSLNGDTVNDVVHIIRCFFRPITLLNEDGCKFKKQFFFSLFF